METGHLELTNVGVTASDVIDVARNGRRVALGDSAIQAITDSRSIVDSMIDRDEPVYGITTGFGALARTFIESDQRAELQQNLIRSHAAGMGEPVETEVVRAMMLLRARTLAMGFSGTRLEVVQTLIDVINAGIVPYVPEHGSLGASGDLAPLSHVAIVLSGEGVVMDGDGVRPAPEALRAHGITPVRFEAKDGVSLINGTDGILGMLVMAIEDIRVLLATAEVAAAMTVEALLGTDRAFADDLHAIRPHPGQRMSAANLFQLLNGSAIVASHRENDPRVQDAYSLRCSPQVIGAARDTLSHAMNVADVELHSAIDNPVVLPDGRIESGGNFHAAPLGYVCDFLAIVLSDVCSMAERRVDRMMDVARSEGLPAFLAEDPGVNSGMMIGQYTCAAMCAENRRLATPASVDSQSTSAGQEDHVSMGWGAARKLRQVVDNTGRVLAVELTAASRGLDFRAPLQPAVGTGAVHRLIREHVEGPSTDRYLAPELAKVEALVGTGAVLDAAEAAVGAFS
jgi:histidine ammonia-lyase